MQTKKTIIIVALIIAALAISISQVNALPLATTADVECHDNAAGTGPAIIQCAVNTQLWIFWIQAPSNTWVTIQVDDPNGNTIVNVPQQTSADSGSITFTTTIGGTYKVKVIGAFDVALDTDEIASQTVFVVPESILGTLGVICAGIAAFGTVKIYQKKKKA